jgi:hypothetical protein
MRGRDLSGQRVDTRRLARLVATQQSPKALPQEVEQALGASEEDVAEIRGVGTAADTLEQRDAKPAFERSNRLRHSGLGKTRRRRGAADALMPGHGLEHAQLPKAGKMPGALHDSS